MGKNIQKIQDMVDGNYKNKIQVGTHVETNIHENRELGERYFDHDGKEWEKTNYGRTSISKLAPVGLGDQCSDCEKLIIKKWDKDVYKWNKRCYYCQIDHEAKFPRNIQHGHNKQFDEHTEYVMERGEEYIKGWMKENEIFKKEMKEEKVFDKSVANTLANNEIDTTNVKLKNTK